MYIGYLGLIFLYFYFTQFILCIKVKNKHIKLIPFYLSLGGLVYSVFVYTEFFGLYNSGSWMQLEAIIYLILIFVILTGIILGYLTANFFVKRRK